MGRFTRAPILLDKSSQLSDAQIKLINNTLKSQYNRMTSQGEQMQKARPDVDTPYSAIGMITSDLVCHSLNGLAQFSCKLNLNGTEGQEFTILETDSVGRLIWSGIYDDVDLSNVATIYLANGSIYIRLGTDIENKTARITIWLYGAR